jgi:DNA-binding CsgD family transcriptional regulator/PAS domain-containing protein
MSTDSSESERKLKLDAAITAASDAISLDEIASHALPALSEAVGACDGFVFRFGHDRLPFGIGKAQWAMSEYVQRRYIDDDPHARFGRHDEAVVRVASELIERKELHRSRAYREFFRAEHVEYSANLRLTPEVFGEPGASFMFMMRRPDQTDFTRGEAEVMAAAMPAFQAAARRHARIEASLAKGKMLETVVETLIGEPVLVFDQQGRPVWRSERARDLVGSTAGESRLVSMKLSDEARRLATASQRDGNARRTKMGVELPHNAGPSAASADLLIATGVRSNHYVIARLHEGKTDSVKLGMLADQYELTPTEAAVLAQIAEGLSNKEIAERQRVSLETARTHVHRVLQKLGVPTRTRAALLTRER